MGKRFFLGALCAAILSFGSGGALASGDSVTVRDRDTLAQDRVGTDAIAGYLRERLAR